MIHPDQCYELRLLQHQDLRAENARERMAVQAIEERRQRAVRTSDRPKSLIDRISAWLRQSSPRHTRMLK